MVLSVLFVFLGIVAGQFTCITCKAAVGQMRNYIETESDIKYRYESFVQDVCITFLDVDTCSGYVYSMSQILFQAAFQHYIQPDYLCYLIKQCTDGAPEPANFDTWADELLSSKPTFTSPEVGPKTINFAQITDIAFDQEYETGTSGICGTAPCCRASSGSGSSGYWGDYNCDVPERTFKSLVSELQSHDLDFIVWTGNSSPHNLLSANRQSQIQYYITSVTDQLLSSMSYIKTPVYPVIGSFDCDPVDQYDLTTSNWLTKYLRAQWTPWLSNSALSQLEKTGSYVQRHKNTNLKIIALNTNACNIRNLWILAGVTDPGSQLAFLEQQLSIAEKNGEYAYILGHIPPGSTQCLNDWSKRYNAIIDRYEATVRGQFFGHEDADTVKLNQGVYTNTPTGVQWIAPPATSYSNRNPSYRVYTADTTSYTVLDYAQYRMDLAAANMDAGRQPVWNQAYTFKQEYFVDSLGPEDLLAWIKSTSLNELKSIKYLQNLHTMGPLTPSSCDSECRESIVCDISQATPLETTLCKNMTESWESYLMPMLYGPWLKQE